MSIGSRLREERERLRLSQADFAEKTGVSRNTIVRYESDVTQPGTGFYEVLRSLEVDVDYVLFGLQEPQRPVECPWLGSDFVRKDGSRFTLEECRQHATKFAMHNNADWWRYCQTCPKNPVKNAVAVAPQITDIDGPLLATILAEIDSTCQDLGLRLSVTKKAYATVMLYRSFKTTSVIDKKHVRDTLMLAAE